MFKRGDNLGKLRDVVEMVLKGSGFGKHAMVRWCLVGDSEKPREAFSLSLSARFRQQTLVVEQKMELEELLAPSPAGDTRARNIQIVYGQMLRDLLNTVETQIV